MSYETLMVQLELGRSNAAPLGVARDVARRMGAAVTGAAAARPLQTLVMAEGFYADNIVQEDTGSIDLEARAAHEEFLAGLNGHAVALDWTMTVTHYPLSGQIAGATDTADLVIVGMDRKSGEFSNSSRHVDVGDLVMQTGRPVLAVPMNVAEFHFRCAMVAWKECREARRALADALPLLKHMERVVIAEVAPADRQGAAQADLDRLVAWLGRHGISATSRLVPSGGDDGGGLLTLAEEIGADLVVAGAYGHSRFREWVLGGVTRDLLHQNRRCLLLSH